MEILNTPNVPQSADSLYEVVCQVCSADIRFSMLDVETQEVNKTATILHITCPSCNNPVEKTLNNKLSERPVVTEKYNHLPF